MTSADLDAIVALDRLSFSDPWPYSAWQQMLTDPHARVWVVETSVGTISLVRSTPEALIEQSRSVVPANEHKIIGAMAVWLVLDEMNIGTIAIHPDYRRQGRGAALLEKGLREGIAEGAKAAHLEVRKSNRAAQRLYERFGFQIVGKRKRYYADNREDAVLMSVVELGETYLQKMVKCRL